MFTTGYDAQPATQQCIQKVLGVEETRRNLARWGSKIDNGEDEANRRLWHPELATNRKAVHTARCHKQDGPGNSA
jgi:hypothetical protein